MSKTKSRVLPSGVFLPGEDLAAYFEGHGDVGAVFDRVHAHFFDSLERRNRKRNQRTSKGGPCDQSHSW